MLFRKSVTLRFACNNRRLGSISCPSIIGKVGGQWDSSPWWGCFIDLKKGKAWSIPCPTFGGAKSCCLSSKGDVTRTRSSYTRGGRRGETLVASTIAIITCRWMKDQVTLDSTMFDEI